MRVVIFAETFLPKWDGVANTLCYLLEYLGATGHDSLMFAPQGAPPTYAHTPIVGLPALAFPLYPSLKLVPPVVNVKTQLLAFGPDLIHLVNPALLGLVGLRYARELDVPVVASYHTDIPGYAASYRLPFLRDPLWAYFRWLHNQADLNLCPSRFTQGQLLEHGFQRVRIWGHGVDTERFNPRHRSSEWRSRLTGGHPNALLLLYVGRLAAEKRVDWLCHVLDAIPGVCLAIVGDGPARPALEQLFAGTATMFTGYLQGQDLACAYASSDIFVFPSASETFGNVIVEAMASGLPVVVPDAGGPIDHVINWQNGFLFDPHSPDDMVAKTRRLVTNPVLVQQLGFNARAYAETQAWSVVLDNLLKDYEATIRGFRLRRDRSRRPRMRMRPRFLPNSGLE